MIDRGNGNINKLNEETFACDGINELLGHNLLEYTDIINKNGEWDDEKQGKSLNKNLNKNSHRKLSFFF